MRNKFLETGEPGYHPIRKIIICLSGLKFAVRHDFSVAYKLVLSVGILAVSFYFRQWLDFLLIMFATVMVLMAELFNSAIEALCDFVEDQKNPKIKMVKDIAAAAVGISILAWIIILGFEVVRLWRVYTILL